jgi:hypothetical protein
LIRFGAPATELAWESGLGIDAKGLEHMVGAMAHVHKVARYVQLLRANPARRAPQLHVNEATTPDDVRLWKQRIRAFDEASIQLKIRTPEEVTEENTRASLDMKNSRVVKYSDYAGFSSRSLR